MRNYKLDQDNDLLQEPAYHGRQGRGTGLCKNEHLLQSDCLQGGVEGSNLPFWLRVRQQSGLGTLTVLGMHWVESNRKLWSKVPPYSSSPKQECNPGFVQPLEYILKNQASSFCSTSQHRPPHGLKTAATPPGALPQFQA